MKNICRFECIIKIPNYQVYFNSEITMWKCD